MGFVWFWLVAIMLVAYVVLDGFDLGVGILHPFLAHNEKERQLMLRTIGPVWDGNEVWLIAAGGTLYFAFPLLYASAFSGFYLALMIVLWLLIMRGASIELRMQVDSGVWRSFFDGLFFFSSALLAIFFGAALANVIRGVPLADDGYFFLPLWTNWRVGDEPGLEAPTQDQPAYLHRQAVGVVQYADRIGVVDAKDRRVLQLVTTFNVPAVTTVPGKHPAGTAHSRAISSSSEPARRISSFSSQGAVFSLSDFSELEQTSSAKSPVWCAGVERTGRIS